METFARYSLVKKPFTKLPLLHAFIKAFGWKSPEVQQFTIDLKPVGNGRIIKSSGDKMSFQFF
jgi:hypothetical protein